MRWSCKAVKHFSKSGGQSILEHCSTLTSTVRSLQFLGKTCKWGNFQQIDLKYQFHGQLGQVPWWWRLRIWGIYIRYVFTDTSEEDIISTKLETTETRTSRHSPQQQQQQQQQQRSGQQQHKEAASLPLTTNIAAKSGSVGRGSKSANICELFAEIFLLILALHHHRPWVTSPGETIEPGRQAVIMESESSDSRFVLRALLRQSRHSAGIINLLPNGLSTSIFYHSFVHSFIDPDLIRDYLITPVIIGLPPTVQYNFPVSREPITAW